MGINIIERKHHDNIEKLRPNSICIILASNHDLRTIPHHILYEMFVVPYDENCDLSVSLIHRLSAITSVEYNRQGRANNPVIGDLVRVTNDRNLQWLNQSSFEELGIDRQRMKKCFLSWMSSNLEEILALTKPNL